MSCEKVPLNQVYRQHVTLQQHPKVNELFEQSCALARSVDFVRQDGSPKGRNYDLAILVTLAGGAEAFEGKRVLEIGGRDGLFGSFVTRFDPKQVVVTDYFEEWGKGTNDDLGTLEWWDKKWHSAAKEGVELQAKCEDATKLSFEDDSFDIVVASSVIEHIFNQARDNATGAFCGDVVAMREMVRVCKPGGLILLSTDMIGDGKCARWHSGTFYYDEPTLERRLLKMGCENTNKCVSMLDDGKRDFSFDSEFCTDIHDHGPDVHPVSGVVFGLRVEKQK